MYNHHKINNYGKTWTLGTIIQTYPDSLFPWTERIFMCRHDPISGGSSSRSFSSTFRVWSRLSQPGRCRIFLLQQTKYYPHWPMLGGRNVKKFSAAYSSSRAVIRPRLSGNFSIWLSSSLRVTQLVRDSKDSGTCWKIFSYSLPPWEQLGWIVIFRILKTKERH